MERSMMQKSTFVLILLGFFLSTFMGHAQEDHPGTNRLPSNSFAVGLYGAPSWPAGISYSQLLNNRVSFEIGVGALSAGGGFTFYLTNPLTRRLNPYTGLFASVNSDGYGMFYLPVGLSYFGKSNFQYSMDVGLMSSENVSMLEGEGNLSPWFGLKVGYRFGEEVETVKTTEKSSKKNILSLQLSSVNVVAGLLYERLISPHLGLEVGFGLIGASIGAKVYFPAIRTEKLGFHMGAFLSDGYSGKHGYFPVGIHWLNEKNFLLSLDAGPQIELEDGQDIYPGFSLRVGKAF